MTVVASSCPTFGNTLDVTPQDHSNLAVAGQSSNKNGQFSDPKYIGDPINAVKIFNEKAVDELAIFDISATASGREPNFELIERIAQVCRMPLCYGE